ncbi:NUDIX hydrolase [Chloroflexota bacterium]
MPDPQWLNWANRLRSIAQAGLTYSENVYDRERYEMLLGLAAEIMEAQTDADYDTIYDLIDGDVGYPTPKVDVRGAIIQDGKILLVQEVLDDNRWTLPGGWADVYDSPSEAIEREVFEEAGYHVKATRLVAVYDRDRWPHPPHPSYTYKLFFLCEIVPDAQHRTGAAATNHETSGIDWFSPDALPELSQGRTLSEQVARCFAHYHDPALPTEFD